MSIIRPTSGVVGTENFLIFNELDVSGSAGSVSIERSAVVKKVVDSELKRCRIRLPLTRDRSELSG